MLFIEALRSDELSFELLIRGIVPTNLTVDDKRKLLRSKIASERFDPESIKKYAKIEISQSEELDLLQNKLIELEALIEKYRDAEIHRVAYALRNSVHESTKHTPSFLAFGRAVPISGEYYGKLEDFTEDQLTIGNREILVRELNELSPLFVEVRKNLHLAYERNAKQYNLRRRPLQLQVGDEVYKRNFVLSDATKDFSKKLAPKYIKAKVIEIMGTNTYKLATPDDKPLGVVHVKDIKLH